MKTYYKWSFCYAIIGMAGGVFFREFTKFNHFDAPTTLGVVHTHAFVLGMLFFLLLLALDQQFHISSQKRHSLFLKLYNAGVLLTIVMLVTRGITQVLGVSMSTGMDAAISGLSGIGHIMTGAGLIIFFLMLKVSIQNKQS